MSKLHLQSLYFLKTATFTKDLLFRQKLLFQKMLFQNNYYFTDNLVFRATLFTYQLVITPINTRVFRPLNNCGCKEWRTIPKIFSVSLMTILKQTKIPQFRAQLDIRPEIMTSRQVSQKMFLV